MKRILCSFALLSLGWLCLSLPEGAEAQVAAAPALLNYQGRLTRPDGTPVADGNYPVGFSLWDTPTGGTMKWNQAFGSLSVRNGVFAVVLSNFPPGTFNNNLWLEIQLGSEAAPLTPRQQLVSVAYAMKANSVPDGSIGAAQIANGAITSDKLANNALSWLLNGNSGTSASNFLGTTDNNPLIFRTNNAERLRLLANGNLGIGTNNPAAKLDVRGAGIVNVFAGDRTPSITAGLETDFTSPQTHAWFAENGNHVFSVRSGGQTVISSTGNLQSHLDVSSNSNIGTWLWLRNTSTGGGSWSIWTSGSNNGEGAGKLIMGNITQTTNGNIGLGISNPTARLDVNGAAGIRAGNTLELGLGVAGKETNAGKIGYQTFTPGSLDIVGAGTNNTNRKIKFWNEGGATFSGEILAPVVTVTGGSDVAEPYHVASAGDVKAIPGMLVAIDEDRVGQMKVATGAYNMAVAGIISGANGIRPGLTLTQKGTVADGEMPVASVGRVWCWCDGDANGAIKAGDLLTSSDTPGHAMKATDRERWDGAIIGKAMSSLKSGKGLVLVLVSLK